MTIHFAAARTPACSPIARALAKRATSRAANDNGGLVPNDDVLKAALRHFGEHGLSAARVARSNAKDAFFAGDKQAYNWWLSITRTLDKRLAQQFERKIESLGCKDVIDPIG